MSSPKQLFLKIYILEAGETANAGANTGGEKTVTPRKERSKSRDMGKRMGGGQKGVWSRPDEIVPPIAKVDDKDPNFDSEGEENVILVSSTGSPKKSAVPPRSELLAAKEYTINPPPELKKRIQEIIGEYFTSGEVKEVQK